MILARLKWLLCLTPFFMAGCMGLDPNTSPRDTFTVEVGYEEVYRRAYEQAQRCWQTDTGYPIGGRIDQATRTAQLYVTGDLGGRLGQVDVSAKSATTSEVTVIVWGVNVWDSAALRAMKEVIQFGVPTCTSYMPRDSYQTSK